MKSLHLLVHGSSREELRKNFEAAWREFEACFAEEGDDANLWAKDEYEFEMVHASCLNEIVPDIEEI